MQTNRFLSALVLVLAILSTAAAQTRETRNVDTFRKISFRVPGKLYLRQGNTQKVEIEGNKDILDDIETVIEGSRLVIGRKSRWDEWNWGNGDRVNVYITVKDIEALSVSGSGDLISETRIVTQDLELKVSGSGSMRVEVEASGDVDADVSGSGDMFLKGKALSYESSVSGSGGIEMTMTIAQNANFNVSGSGKIIANGSAASVKTSVSGSGKVLASNLATNKCVVRISGSGDVEINVTQELDATISGSGSVSYKGDPAKINSHASGSGKLRKM